MCHIALGQAEAKKKREEEWDKEQEEEPLPEKPAAFDMPKGQTWNGIGAFRVLYCFSKSFNIKFRIKG